MHPVETLVSYHPDLDIPRVTGIVNNKQKNIRIYKIYVSPLMSMFISVFYEKISTLLKI